MWEYVSHNMARSKAYRWAEQGIAGISDDLQFLCFSLALWNGRDPILFYKYFHGDTGCGVGASHQTGWTGLGAKLLQARREG